MAHSAASIGACCAVYVCVSCVFVYVALLYRYLLWLTLYVVSDAMCDNADWWLSNRCCLPVQREFKASNCCFSRCCFVFVYCAIVYMSGRCSLSFVV